MNTLSIHRPKFTSLAIVPLVSSSIACLVGALVLLGWWLHVPQLTGICASYPTLSPTDAVGFIFAGIALALLRTRGAGCFRYRLGLACAGYAASVGLIRLVEYTFDLSPGFDNLLSLGAALATPSEAVVRVSFLTSLALSITGLAILSLDVSFRRVPRTSQLLAIVAINLSVLALVGYIVRNSGLYIINRSQDAGMALHSTLLTGLLSLGILCARPKVGFVAVLLSAGGGGVLARRLLFAPLALPLLFLSVGAVGQQIGLFGKDFVNWLMWFGYLTTFMFVIWWVANIVQTAERERNGHERRVQHLNEELVEANKELEAFSYSVSHDLRAPLRAIDGFSRILLEECVSGLEEDHANYLCDIRQNAQQMGQLIDALLSFAKLSRQPLKKHLVQMNDLVEECLGYLKNEDAVRKLQLNVCELPPCEADRSLLKQVWQNLIDNALKYSRHRDPAIIEIGCTTTARGGPHTYYVRDNGTGFDMQYAGKLFGVFQRLHRVEDFAGTGVGLAIVQRILHRHGGLAWAEAEPDKGATFFFTFGEGAASP